MGNTFVLVLYFLHCVRRDSQFSNVLCDSLYDDDERVGLLQRNLVPCPYYLVANTIYANTSNRGWPRRLCYLQEVLPKVELEGLSVNH